MTRQTLSIPICEGRICTVRYGQYNYAQVHRIFEPLASLREARVLDTASSGESLAIALNRQILRDALARLGDNLAPSRVRTH